jgi:4-hydroxyphenylpyruvate dioxygenase
MQSNNPAGTNGFDFLEYTTNDVPKLSKQFEAMGFKVVAKHKTHDITLYQQNDVRFLLNNTPNSMAKHFAKDHNACVCAMGFKVENAKHAYEQCIAKGARPYFGNNETHVHAIPAIHGVGGSLIYFVDYQSGIANYADAFTFSDTNPTAHTGKGLTYIDHVTHNLHRGNMDTWADFYTKHFNFREIRYFDIEGKLTGLKSRAMTSPCGKIRIPLNESSDDKSQIEEFIKDFNGEGIQHIALGSDNIYSTVEQLRANNIEFLNTPDTYYELIEKRLPNHGEPVDAMKKLSILVDGNTKDGDKKLLLQIFTQNMLGPVFFEVIQRKGDEGFGEGNFRALFESIELDQIRRGVLEDKEGITK